MECPLHFLTSTRAQHSTHHSRTHLSPTGEIHPLTPTNTIASPQPSPTGRTFSPTVLESQRFTSNNTSTIITLPSTPLVELNSPRQCTHPRCTLANQLHRTSGTAQGNDIYCQQCHTFNHAAHHATRLERAVTTRPYLRQVLAELMFHLRSGTIIIHQNTVNNIIM